MCSFWALVTSVCWLAPRTRIRHKLKIFNTILAPTKTSCSTVKGPEGSKVFLSLFFHLHPFCLVPLLRPLLVIWSSRRNSPACRSRAAVRWCPAPRFSGCRSLWPWCAWPGSLQLQRCSDCPKGERWTAVSSSSAILSVFVFFPSRYC